MSGVFHGRPLDDDPRLLGESYRLRYQVYCVERKFLPAEKYPDQSESDEFDRHSVHVGVLDAAGDLAGTARVVSDSSAGLPLFRYCRLFPDENRVFAAGNRVVEVSRLSVSRKYSRRRDDPFWDAPPPAPLANQSSPAAARERRRGRDDVFLTLLAAVYQAIKRLSATHCIVATEQSLQRLGALYGFPFHIAGPESEYSGRVAPYIMSISELDRVLLECQPAVLAEFMTGLEPGLWPGADGPGSPVPPAHGPAPLTVDRVAR